MACVPKGLYVVVEIVFILHISLNLIKSTHHRGWSPIERNGLG